MSIVASQVQTALSASLPSDVIAQLLTEYLHIKHQFFLGRFSPSELNAARFSECALRLIEFLDTGSYTPLGKQINSETIINRVSSNVTLPDGVRFFVPRLARVLLDIRNKRNVAHVGGEVDPNYSDSLFVSQAADWVLVEIIRNYHTNDIGQARMIVESINETRIPIVTEIDGFVRVQNTALDATHKTLVILYHKLPSKVTDLDLAKWLRYSNISRFRTQILKRLDDDALIHYQTGLCSLLPKGIAYVEKNIRFDVLA